MSVCVHRLHKNGTRYVESLQQRRTGTDSLPAAQSFEIRESLEVSSRLTLTTESVRPNLEVSITLVSSPCPLAHSPSPPDLLHTRSTIPRHLATRIDSIRNVFFFQRRMVTFVVSSRRSSTTLDGELQLWAIFYEEEQQE